jgi:NADH-quinone oxidoreductase subunit A
MLSDFGIILLAIILAAVAVLAVLGIAWMLRPAKPNDEKTNNIRIR